MEELGDLSRVQGRRHWRGEGGEVLLYYGLPHHQHIGRVPCLYMGQLGTGLKQSIDLISGMFQESCKE